MADINWNELTDSLVASLKDGLQKDLPQIKEYAQRIAEEQKQVLQELIELKRKGLITAEEMASELADERVTIANQLLAMKEMGTAAAQRATNGVIKALQDFASSAAKGIL